MKQITLLTCSFILFPFFAVLMPMTATAQEDSYTVEYYYKAKWGYLDEFLDLYKKNHYPILKELKKQGQILDMKADFPINHAPESARWDFRYTITFRNYAASRNKALSDAIGLQLYPDQEKFKKEEQRRFEILLEHMDVPIRSEKPEEWK